MSDARRTRTTTVTLVTALVPHELGPVERIVGIQSPEGIMLAQRDGKWMATARYNGIPVLVTWDE